MTGYEAIARNPLWTPPLASVVSLFQKADTPGIVIITVLFCGSIYVWSLMLSKYQHLKAAKRRSQAFLTQYRRLAHPAVLYLEDGFSARSDGSNPIEAVYAQCCASLQATLDVQGVDARGEMEHGTLSQVALSDRQVHSVQTAAERMVADQALRLESQMGHLASSASIAPFLGLLGTVIGVMNAFGSMAGSGTALLSEVAPGIASALLTTVVGLLVALPSVFGYNLLSDQVRQITVMMDNFAQELVGDLERVHVA